MFGYAAFSCVTLFCMVLPPDVANGTSVLPSNRWFSINVFTVMLLMPMLLIVFYSLVQPGNEVTTFRFTLANYIRFFTDRDFLLILVRSLTIALKTRCV